MAYSYDQKIVDAVESLYREAIAEGLEMATVQAHETAGNLYCQSLQYCSTHCLGLQIIEKFTPEQQQEKLKEVGTSEQLMGGHVHLEGHTNWCRQEAARVRGGG
jgi:hypothetical protein